MIRIVRSVALAAVTALALGGLSACGDDDGDSGSDPLGGDGGKGSVVVGSANFDESLLLGEIYAQALEAKKIKVTRKFKIGAREVYYDQVKSGAIGIIPEYNGALLSTSVDKESTAVTTEQINAALKAKLPAELEILDTAKAEDKDSVTVNTATAQKYSLKSIADLAKVGNQITLGGPSEFKTRTQGLKGLQKAYGLKVKEFKSFDAAAQATLVRELKNNKIQAADLFTTDPAILANKFVVLEDPKTVFSAQNVTALVNKSKADATAKQAVNAVIAKLTTQDLLDMNGQMAAERKDAKDVAREWLSKSGLA